LIGTQKASPKPIVPPATTQGCNFYLSLKIRELVEKNTSSSRDPISVSPVYAWQEEVNATPRPMGLLEPDQTCWIHSLLSFPPFLFDPLALSKSLAFSLSSTTVVRWPFQAKPIALSLSSLSGFKVLFLGHSRGTRTSFLVLFVSPLRSVPYNDRSLF
jgi:hypothetical protein